MNFDIQFYDKVIVRSPRFSLSKVEDKLEIMLNDLIFMEAVYIASPPLYKECERFRNNKNYTEKEKAKLHASLLKYNYRMATRPTPFGLFSGCHVSGFTNKSQRIVIDGSDINTHSRLDMEYLCQLTNALVWNPEIREQLTFYSNNSIYRIGNDWRYVEYSCKLNKRTYQITEIPYQDILKPLLAAGNLGLKISDLKILLQEIHLNADENEIKTYIDELIDSQLFISELEPGTTGIDQLTKICNKLDCIILEDNSNLDLRANLHQVTELLSRIDKQSIDRMQGIKEIVSCITSIGVPFDEAKLFHTDLYRKQLSGGVNSNLKQELGRALTVLNQLTPEKENVNLKNFREKFYIRYEDSEVPLLQVLDTETGIGYLNSDYQMDLTPLIDDVVLTSSTLTNTPMYWNDIEQLLHDKILNKQNNSITISSDDIAHLSAHWDNLPSSLPVVFRLLEDEQVYIESCGGSSAVNLLGRFAGGNQNIKDIILDIVEKEQRLEPNILYAEIVHLPENRLGNILFHPSFRCYEIPYVALSDETGAQAIPLNDLYISIKNNRIILRSAKFNKEIIPRLSNAHNFSKNSLPIYQFLCDLQCQGKRSGLHFSWGSLRKIYTSLPRITYGNIIISLAQWNFTHLHARELLSLTGPERRKALLHFKTRWCLPRELFIAEGDHELYIDLENELLVDVWLERIRKKGYTLVKEYIKPGDYLINQHQERYANQFIAIIQPRTSIYENVLSPVLINPSVKRSFTTGSEWIYYKIYCGIRSADKIILQLVKPVCEELEDAGILNKWFFIRYNDPQFHLRVRFNTNDVKYIGQIIEVFNKWAEPLLHNGSIWRIQNDTYNRELERYGSNSIGLIEKIFCKDSEAVMNMIQVIQFDESENFRWMFAMKSVDELYNSFGLSLEDKSRLTEIYRQKFSVEFSVDRQMKMQFDQKYRHHRIKIERWLTNEGLLLEDPDELSAIRNLFERTKEITPIAFKLKMMTSQTAIEVSQDAIISSLVHMAINRVITSKPRLHELVIYDMLSRLYNSRLARNKYKGLITKSEDYFTMSRNHKVNSSR